MTEFLAVLEAAGSQALATGRNEPAQQAVAKRIKPRLPAKRPLQINPLILVAAAAGCTVIGAVGYYVLFYGG